MPNDKFYVYQFDPTEEDGYANIFGVLQNAECAQGCERTLAVAYYEKQEDAEKMCAALNKAYNDANLTEFEVERDEWGDPV